MSKVKEKFRDRALPIRTRVNDLLSRMTLEEKVAQLRQDLYGWKCYQRDGDEVALTPYLTDYLAKTPGIGCLYGVFRADPWSQVTDETGIPSALSRDTAFRIQKQVMAANRFGIPALFVEEAPHGHQALGSVSYPINIGKGNSYDPALMEQMATQIRHEMAAKGVHIALVSTMDLARDPRWGRTEECLSEDGVIAAKYTEAIVKGFQGDLIHAGEDFLDQPVATHTTAQMGVVLKHVIGQGDTLGGHNSGSSIIGRRELLDIYGPLLHAARNAVGVMAAYNDIDGVPCHGNPWLLTDLLRKQNGFQGLIMADGSALDRLATNYTQPGLAARQALTAGVEESLWDELYPHLVEYVTSGLVPEALVDQAAFKILAIKFLLGVFDDPFKTPAAFDETHAQSVNLELAEESITMVKNTGILPLKTAAKIAVIGPSADNRYDLLGDYTAPQTAGQHSTIYQAIKAQYPASDVRYAKGCAIRDHEHQPQLLNEAVALAQASDVVILTLGGSSTRNFGMRFGKNGAVSSKGINMDSGENVDLASLALGGEQPALLEALAKTGKPMITIMVEGRPHELEQVLAKSAAVLLAWYPGQRGGDALAALISGQVAPSGHLNISYPRSAGQLPVYHNQRRNPAPDYYDEAKSPLLALGTGLSYGEPPVVEGIQLDQTTISKVALQDGAKLEATALVHNPNDTAATAVLLVATNGLTNNVVPRASHVVDFKRVTLAAHEHRQVTFTLEVTAFQQTDFSYQPRLFEGPVTVTVNGQTASFTIK